ncbi:MAG: O-antigen polysaccharide polymerase Wzy, partial [Proteobacteria bacterium]
LGLGATYFYLPLIFTTLEFNPLHNKLTIPIEDFSAVLALYICLILMQRFCARFSLTRSLRRCFSHRVLKPLGFFSTPSELQLWGMGMVGVIGFLVGHSSTHEADSETLEKFFQSFRIFTFAPFLLLVPQMIGGTNKIKKSATALIIFTVVLFCLAMSTGSRGYTVVGLVTAVCSYWLGVWTGVMPGPRIKFRHVALVGIGVFLMTGPLAVAFTAAQAAASGKGRDRSISEAFSDFVEAFSTKDIVENYKFASEKASQREGAWTEDYLNNEFLRRFANLIFLDNTFSISLTLDDSARERLAKLEALRMLSILPDPMIQFLELDVNKKEDLKGTMGDLFYNETQSADTGLGSFKTGSLVASSYNLFGWGFPL